MFMSILIVSDILVLKTWGIIFIELLEVLFFS
jgi:hypothetical protein